MIHIGLVQVVVKPLTTQALNASVLLCLRDSRHLDFQDFLLGVDNPICIGQYLWFPILVMIIQDSYKTMCVENHQESSRILS